MNWEWRDDPVYLHSSVPQYSLQFASSWISFAVLLVRCDLVICCYVIGVMWTMFCHEWVQCTGLKYSPKPCVTELGLSPTSSILLTNTQSRINCCKYFSTRNIFWPFYIFFSMVWLRKRFHCVHYTLKSQIGHYLKEPFVLPFSFLFNYHRPRTFFFPKNRLIPSLEGGTEMDPESNSYKEYNIPEYIAETYD